MTSPTNARPSKAALASFICGIAAVLALIAGGIAAAMTMFYVTVGTIPDTLSEIRFVCGAELGLPLLLGPLAVVLGIQGFFNSMRPGRRGRWLAITGGTLGLLDAVGAAGAVVMLASLSISGLPNAGSINQPRQATHDFIAALARGDDVEAKKHSALDDASFAQAKAMVQAQGDFVDTAFNNISVNEGGSGHVSGTATFKAHTLRVSAELASGPEGWRITAIELLP